MTSAAGAGPSQGDKPWASPSAWAHTQAGCSWLGLYFPEISGVWILGVFILSFPWVGVCFWDPGAAPFLVSVLFCWLTFSCDFLKGSPWLCDSVLALSSRWVFGASGCASFGEIASLRARKASAWPTASSC